ncbi:MAG TPA: CPBP family intramembrane glutamic endopeptidase [Puia sp.]
MRLFLRVFFFWIVFLLLWMGLSRFIGNGLGGCTAALGATLLFLRIERRAFASIGLVWERRTPGRFLLGIGLGAGLYGLIVLVTAIWTGRLPLPQPIDRGRLMGILILFLLSVAEEVGFRGYPLVRLQEALGVRLSQWVVAIAFALYHVAYGWNVWVAFTGPFVWSFAFSLAAIRWRGIAVPVGVHLAVNVLQGLFTATGNHRDVAPGWVTLVVEAGLLGGFLVLTEWLVRWRRKYFPN